MTTKETKKVARIAAEYGMGLSRLSRLVQNGKKPTKYKPCPRKFTFTKENFK